MKLKVCGLTNKKNIGEILRGIHPDYMGFIFYEHSSRFVENKLDAGFMKTLPESIQKTGVFVDAPGEYILDRAKQYGLNTLQMHGNESPDFCRRFMDEGYEVIKAFKIYKSFTISTMHEYRDSCDYFLFDTAGKLKGGTGVKFNWAIIQQYTLNKPFFLSGGVAPGDEADIKSIKDHRLYAVDINSRFEISKGIKNADQVKQFYNTLKNNENE
ncbi:MAG: phosphoribosylanthranilate isomerase [Bacteroidales bacterium]